MSVESSNQYAVYNLRTTFSRQPGDLTSCPVCGGSISISDIAASKCVSNDLSDPYLICVHEFTRLYRCRCGWWAVRESWTLCEWDKEYDFLIVGLTAHKEPEGMKPEDMLWRQVLEKEDVYQSVVPMPEALKQLFQNHEG